MEQPTKKPRTTSGSDTGESSTAKPVIEINQQTEDLVSALSTTLDSLESSSSAEVGPLISNASVSLLGLKALQRTVLEDILKTQRILEKQKQRRNEQELKIQNQTYQKALNEHSIHVCQDLTTSQLVKLCRSEIDSSLHMSSGDEALKDFLGADPNDPSQRSTIVAKLNQQLNARTELEADLKRCRLKANTLKQSLNAKRKLLNELPNKLHEVERASMPLQKFCRKSLNASKKLGTERRTCLDLAQSLPKALYTLYYQLQSCLDIMGKSTETGENDVAPDALPSLEVDETASSVLLKISIPSVSGGSSTSTVFGNGKRLATISFGYNEAEDMVFAQCASDQEIGNVLMELFPGDTGELIAQEDEETPTTTQGAYHWCNYIAGLHLPHEQPTSSNLRQSSMVVVRTLIRRVYAGATVHWLIHALSRKPNPIPVHPLMKGAFTTKDNLVKLTAWSEQPNSATADTKTSPGLVFLATLKRKSATLQLRVSVDSTHYPGVPPKWELNATGQSTNSLEEETTLYDDGLASLERNVNDDVESMVVANNEETYRWILSHQLAEIVKGWGELLQASENGP